MENYSITEQFDALPATFVPILILEYCGQHEVLAVNLIYTCSKTGFECIKLMHTDSYDSLPYPILDVLTAIRLAVITPVMNPWLECRIAAGDGRVSRFRVRFRLVLGLLG